MRYLIIPDVHLKPVMLDQAHDILERGLADRAVSLGDLFDDWGEEAHIVLYDNMAEKMLEFHKKHPNTLWCMGNHDFGYYHPEWGERESGHSWFAEETMRDWTRAFEAAGLKQQITHQVDKVLFCHGGVNRNWVKKHIEPDESFYQFLGRVNGDDFPLEVLWEEDSPLWWRPQEEYGGDVTEASNVGRVLQVVGHSPMKTPKQENSVLSCDVFSTYSNGAPYGDRSWVVVDTETKEWECLGDYDTICGS